MAYPSTISAISSPLPTDRLNSPSHSSIHGNVNTAISEIQTFVGTLSSAVGTLVYDIRATGSNGGGHVQTAAKGGTGQTTFAKGDLLVGQNASTLTKLATGVDGQVLTASSALATGVGWATPGGTKIAVSSSVVTVIAGGNEVSVLSVTIPGSTLGTTNGIRAKMFVNFLGFSSDTTNTLRVNYGTTSIASVNFFSTGAASSSIKGVVEVTIVAGNTVSSQLGTLNIRMSKDQINPNAASVQGILSYNISQPTYENSSANRTLGITYHPNGTGGNRIDTGGYVVERIV